MSDVSETRRRAWKTRRAKYGQQGHSGSYARTCASCRRMVAVLIELHDSGALSEGQVAKATGLDRIAIRRAADELHMRRS